MRRAWLTVVLLVMFGLTGTARAERDLAQAIDLAIQEATNVEEDIGAGLLLGTPIAKRLRRGKSSLQQGLAKHGQKRWQGATLKLGKGLANLIKAFQEHGDGQAGLAAVIGVVEELYQHVAATVTDLDTRADELPESQTLTRAREQLAMAGSLRERYLREPNGVDGLVAILGAYELVGKAAKKVAKLESRGKTDVAHLGKFVPGNLPKAQYHIRWWVDDQLINAGYMTNDHEPKLQKTVIRDWIRSYAENRIDGRDCIEEVTGVPFDGVRFSIDVVLDCPVEGGGRETITLRFVVTRVVE